MSSPSSRAIVRMCCAAFSAAVKTAPTRSPMPLSSTPGSSPGPDASSAFIVFSLPRRTDDLFGRFLRRNRIRLDARRNGAATEAETLELPRRQFVEATLLEVAERIRTDRSQLLIGEIENGAARKKLLQDRVGRACREGTAHRARLARPGHTQRRVEPQQGERRNEPNRKREQDAEVLGAVPAVAPARLGAPAGRA